MIKGDKIYLRAVEPEDVDFIFNLENDINAWKVSQTLVPFSKEMISSFVNSAGKDIYSSKQLRLMIVHSSSNEVIGAIDLFDFDPKNKRAGVGIIIDREHRERGIAKEALSLLINYSFDIIDLHQLYCNILEDNDVSLKLFESCGFVKIGMKRDWIRWNNQWSNEFMLQLINK